MPLMPLNTHRKFTVSQNRQTRSRVCSPLLSPLLPAVVAELDDVVLVAVPLRVHYEAEKSLLLLLPVDHHPPPEEPVTTVLTGKDKESLAAYKYQKHTTHRAVPPICSLQTTPPIGLGQVKTFHTGGVPFNPLEHRCVVVQIPGVKGQACTNHKSAYIKFLNTEKNNHRALSSFHPFTIDSKRALLKRCTVLRSAFLPLNCSLYINLEKYHLTLGRNKNQSTHSHAFKHASKHKKADNSEMVLARLHINLITSTALKLKQYLA